MSSKQVGKVLRVLPPKKIRGKQKTTNNVDDVLQMDDFSDIGVTDNLLDFTNSNTEVVARKLVTELAEMKVSPHFYIDDPATYATQMTLRGFLVSQPQISEQDLSIIFFQIYTAIYALQTYFSMSHHNLTWNNIFVEKNEYYEEGAVEKYTVSGIDYYIPSYPHTFKIADYRFAQIPEKLENPQLEAFYALPYQENRLGADYIRITSVLWKFQQFDNISHILETAFTQYRMGANIAPLFPLLFSAAKTQTLGSSVVVSWNIDKKIPAIAPELRKYAEREMVNRGVNLMPSVPENSPVEKKSFAEACEYLLSLSEEDY